MRSITLLAGLIAQAISPVASAVSLDDAVSGNATVQSPVRYATPQGEAFGGPPINPPPTGAGTAMLSADPYDNGTGISVSFFGSGIAGPYASASATLAAGPFNPAGQGVVATAYTYYAFEVVGTPAQTGSLALVNVKVSGSVAASPTAADGDASASVIFDDLTGTPARLLDLQTTIACQGSTCTTTPGPMAGFSYLAFPVQVPVNDIVGVYLNASANSYVPLGSSDTPGTMSAVIDPTLTLDPSNPPGLVLAVSSQIQQPVPEPATLSLLLGGLAFLGLRSGRRATGRH